MARGKDLAGLAALGALGMMLSKGKGGKGKGEDRDTVPGTNIPIAGGESEAETFPNEYRYKVEKDFGGSSNIGEGYGPAPSSMMRREPTASRARATTPVRSMAKARPRLDTSGVTDMDSTGGAESPDQTGGRGVDSRGSLGTKLVQGYGGRRFHPEYDTDVVAGRARDRALNAQLGGFDQGPAGSTYKKGGAVKKMVSGGMASSASKRADGIAQKGKTRGKVC